MPYPYNQRPYDNDFDYVYDKLAEGRNLDTGCVGRGCGCIVDWIAKTILLIVAIVIFMGLFS